MLKRFLLYLYDQNTCTVSFLLIGAELAITDQGSFLNWFIEKVVSRLFRILMRTVNFRLEGLEHLAEARRQGGFILVLWHGNILPLLYLLRDRQMYSLVSPSWEGELIASGMKGLGYNLVRASSKFSPAKGLRASARLAKRGEAVAVIVDGPEGPRHEVKNGAIYLSSLAQVPMLPVFGTTSKFIKASSWDKHEIPLPFQKGIIRFGEPIYIKKKVREEETESHCDELKQVLMDIEDRVRQELDAWDCECK